MSVQDLTVGTTFAPPADASSRCIVCQANSEPELVFVGSEDRFDLGGSFSVVRCLECGFTWTQLPDDFDLDEWYARGYWKTEPSRSAMGGASRARTLWRLWNGSVRPSRWIQSGRVLDLGCGPGYDTVEMLKAGAHPVAVDPSRDALLMAAEKDLPGFQSSAEYLPFKDCSFDAVVMSQVLEHARRPDAALLEARRVLKKDGRILILLPNARSVQRRVFRAKWINWHLPFHLWHFDISTLSQLLRNADLEVHRTSSASPGEWFLLSVAARWPWLESLGRKRPLGLAVRLLVAPLFRITDLFGAGDCLVVEARKASLERGNMSVQSFAFEENFGNSKEHCGKPSLRVRHTRVRL